MSSDEAGRALHAQLDYPLPREIEVGAGTAVFVCGWCFSPRASVRSLELVVGGEPQPLMAHGMPRSDVFGALHPSIDPFESAGMPSDPESRGDPSLRSFRSGFWGMARLDPSDRDDDDIEIGLRASLADGNTADAGLARVRLIGRSAEPAAARQPDPDAGPFVAICMATYEPPPELFRRQLASIRAQTHRNWVCVISDDCSSPDRFAEIESAVQGDARFVVSRSPERLHFYRNFERALTLAPEDAAYVAMADQDDFWHPDKLESLLGAIGGAQLAYSDQRIVSPSGELIADTYWSRRRPNHKRLLSLLVANSVTGAASLFPRRLLDDALPFPPRQFAHFHDHWLALTAASLGEITFVDRPLYDYVQHGSAVLGHEAANRMPALGDRVAKLREDPRERVRRWRLHYFVDCCRLIQFTTILEMRCGDRLSIARRRELESFPRAERSPVALANLARRAARELVGEPETLGAEMALFFAFAWRRLLVAATRGLERPRRRLRIDARPPTTLVQVPGRTASNVVAVGTLAAKIAPLELAVREDAPSRVNILIPTIDLEHFFGGYITKLNLAARLAERGARVRIVTVDPVGVLPSSWRQTLESYSGLAGVFDRVEVVFGRESQGIEVSRTDSFVATTWWTAHIAADAARGARRRTVPVPDPGARALYLPDGELRGARERLLRAAAQRALLERASARLLPPARHRGVRRRRRGGRRRFRLVPERDHRDRRRPPLEDLARREPRRLLFYARPEPHAARNMFELGVLALTRAVENGVFDAGWELNGIGTVGAQRRIELGRGARLDLLPRREQDAYATVLREHDVGLALMYTPHPSLVPIEMASAGMATVTNSFENKTPEAMTAISSNLVTVEPSIDSLAAGLAEAVRRSQDLEGRAAWQPGELEPLMGRLLRR